MEPNTQLIYGEAEIQACVDRLSAEIHERTLGARSLAIVGIHQRGVTIARRVVERIRTHREDVLEGSLDISLYRDDFDNLGTVPKLVGSDIPFQIEGSHVVLFDDVLFTGRTTRAAIDALMDFGRPSHIELAVMVDRGNRELPIAAQYIGRKIETSLSDYIGVHLHENDGEDAIYITRKTDA